MSDLGIFLTDNITFNIKLTATDFEKDDGLQTAVTISLFTDKRVTEEEKPQGAESRAGFWGDMFPDVDKDQIGSKLWTLARSKRTIETLRRAEDYAKESLEWLIEDGIASKIETSAEFTSDQLQGQWVLFVSITRPSGRTSRFSYIWDAQKLIEVSNGV